MRDFASCFNEHAVRVSESSTCTRSVSSSSSSIVKYSSSSSSSSASGHIHPSSVQSSVSCFYRSKLSTSQKQLLMIVTWAKSLSIAIVEEEGEENQQQRLLGQASRPLLLRTTKGNRSYMSPGGFVMTLCWDISSAKYDTCPEPVEGFYVAVVADGEFVLLLGDMASSCQKDVVAADVSSGTAGFSLVGRREHLIGNSSSLCSFTKTRFGDNGGAHEISIECKKSELSVCVDKKMVVNVRRLRWNFRGNQTIFVDGLPVDMMWDVHNWWFSTGSSNAVFMFRTRTSLENRLWLEDDTTVHNIKSDHHRHHHGKSGFSLLLIHARNTSRAP